MQTQSNWRGTKKWLYRAAAVFLFFLFSFSSPTGALVTTLGQLAPPPLRHTFKNWSDKNCLIDWINCAWLLVHRPQEDEQLNRLPFDGLMVWFGHKCSLRTSPFVRRSFFFFSFFCSLSLFEFGAHRNVCKDKTTWIWWCCWWAPRTWLQSFIQPIQSSVAAASSVTAKNGSQKISHITHWTCVHFNFFFSFFFSIKTSSSEEREHRTRLGEQIKSSKSQPIQFVVYTNSEDHGPMKQKDDEQQPQHTRNEMNRIKITAISCSI